MIATFFKHLPSRSPEEIQCTFEKYTELYIISKDIPNFKMPKAISYDSSGINFEWLDFKEHLSSDIYKGVAISSDNFFRIGQALGILWSRQNGPQSNRYIHGDFMAHNIFIDEDDIVFFDFDPPENEFPFSDFHRNNQYVDIGTFIFSLCISHSFLHPWKFLRNKRKWTQAFIVGYEQTSEQYLDKEEIRKAITSAYLRWKNWNNNFSKNKYIVKVWKHLLIHFVILFQIEVCNILT